MSITVESNESTVKQPRSEYLREWRANNPDKVRRHKQNYYQNHSEKEKKRQRNHYKKTKRLQRLGQNVGRPNDLVCLNPIADGLSPSKFYKFSYINDNMNPLLFEKLKRLGSKVKFHTVYKLIKKYQNQYEFEAIRYCEFSKVDISELEQHHKQDLAEIRKKYNLLKPLEIT